MFGKRIGKNSRKGGWGIKWGKLHNQFVVTEKRYIRNACILLLPAIARPVIILKNYPNQEEFYVSRLGYKGYLNFTIPHIFKLASFKRKSKMFIIIPPLFWQTKVRALIIIIFGEPLFICSDDFIPNCETRLQHLLKVSGITTSYVHIQILIIQKTHWWN